MEGESMESESAAFKPEVRAIVLNLDQVIALYFATMSEQEIQIFNLAQKLLGSSFELEKSIGFLEYLKTNNITIEK